MDGIEDIEGIDGNIDAKPPVSGPGGGWWASQSRKRSGSSPTGVLLPWPAGASDELKLDPVGCSESTWLPGANVDGRWRVAVEVCPDVASPAPGGTSPPKVREPAAVGRFSGRSIISAASLHDSLPPSRTVAARASSRGWSCILLLLKWSMGGPLRAHLPRGATSERS